MAVRGGRSLRAEVAHDDDARDLRAVRAVAAGRQCAHRARRGRPRPPEILGLPARQGRHAAPDRALDAAGVPRPARLRPASAAAGRADGGIPAAPARGPRACGIPGDDGDLLDLRQHGSELHTRLRCPRILARGS